MHLLYYDCALQVDVQNSFKCQMCCLFWWPELYIYMKSNKQLYPILLLGLVFNIVMHLLMQVVTGGNSLEGLVNTYFSTFKFYCWDANFLANLKDFVL